MIGPVALLLCAAAAATDASGALGRAAADIAGQTEALMTSAQPDRARGAAAVAVFVEAPGAPELARAAQTAVVAALVQHRGLKAALASRAPDAAGAEAEARAAGLDFAVRLTARVDPVAGLALAGDVVPTWVNFWAGRDPVRSGAGGGALAARVPADAQALALAHLGASGPGRTAALARRWRLRPLAPVDEPVVALALGDLDGDGLAEVVALTPSRVLVLAPGGALLAERDERERAPAARAVREPAGALAIGRFGAGAEAPAARIGAFAFAHARGEVLELVGRELRAVGELDAAPLAAGAAGELLGQPVPGRNAAGPEVRGNSGAAATLPFAPVGFAAAPRCGEPAFVVVDVDGAVLALDGALRAAPLPPLAAAGVGAGVAVGDLDGDGLCELVTTGRVRRGDRARVVRLEHGAAEALFESEVVAGRFVAAAAGDLDGDGRDEAVLAAWTEDGGRTVLYRLEGEP